MTEFVLEPDVVEQIDDRIVRVPLRTATLRPATRTNHYLVQGEAGWLLVDLGVEEPSELAILAEAVQSYCGGWSGVCGLLLTHHHIDHAAGLEWWASQVRKPVWAHERTFKKLGGAARRCDAQRVDEGSRVGGMRVEFTPGHASGHLSLDVDGGTLIAGDLVAGFGTILIDPPDGEMGAYIDSLWRMSQRGWSRVAPSHGGVLEGEVFGRYRAHRLARESRVLGGLAVGELLSTEEIALSAYADSADAPIELTHRSALAHLLYLGEQGLVTQVGRGTWKRR